MEPRRSFARSLSLSLHPAFLIAHRDKVLKKSFIIHIGDRSLGAHISIRFILSMKSASGEARARARVREARKLYAQASKQAGTRPSLKLVDIRARLEGARLS